MSHQPERKEKDCLNCGATVQGRFCQVCGQENIVTRQSFGSLARHFIFDVLHFDGKFFETLKYLLIRPGFVPMEYAKGKRNSYLDPIRMYLFTSAVFFLVLFSISKPEEGMKLGRNRTMTKQERLDYASYLHSHLGREKDSVGQRQLNFLLDTSYQVRLKQDSLDQISETSFPVSLNGQHYLMVAEKRKDEIEIHSSSGWIENTLKNKWQKYQQKYGDDDRSILVHAIESFQHKIPYLLFVSLPFFAFILKLLYLRRKNYYYSDHAVFTLYHYIVTFILLLLYFLVDALNDRFQIGVLGFLSTCLILSGGLYLFISMKRFYGQGWRKTLGKFLLLNFMGLLVLLLLLIIFFVFSIFQL